MPDKNAIAIVIRNELGQYLMGIRTAEPHVGFLIPPMGRINEGETPEDTARREAYEEAGLLPNNSKIRKLGLVFDRSFGYKVAFYEIQPPHKFGEIPSKELREVRFCNYGDVREDCPPIVKAALDALENGLYDFSLEVK